MCLLVQGLVTVYLPSGVATDLAFNPITESNQLTFIYDTVSPVATLSTSAATLSPGLPIRTNNYPIPVAISFDHEVVGFVESEVTVTLGTTTNFVEESGQHYTVGISPSDQDSQVSVVVLGDVIRDKASNPNLASNSLTFVYDTVPPSVSASSSYAATTKESPIPITFAFSEGMSGLAIGDLVVVNGTLDNFQAVGSDTFPKNYTVDLYPNKENYIVVSLPQGVATDEALNENQASNNLVFLFDTTNPLVTVINSPSLTYTNTAPIPLVVEFNEPTFGFKAGDFLVEGVGGNITDFTGSDGDKQFSANLGPFNQGWVSVLVPYGSATDKALNLNQPSNTLSFVYDTVNPTVVLTTTEPEETRVNPVTITATFSEEVVGFNISHVYSSSGAKQNFVQVSPSVYTLEILINSDSRFTVKVQPGATADLATNPNLVSNVLSFIADFTPIGIRLRSDTRSYINEVPIPISISFSEPVAHHSFKLADITLTHSQGGSPYVMDIVNTSTSAYTFNLIPGGEGNVTVQIGVGVLSDVALNLNDGPSNMLWFVYDTTHPTADLLTTTPFFTKHYPLNISVSYSEDMLGFSASDLYISGGYTSVAEVVEVSPVHYTVDVTPNAEGTVVVKILEGAVTDLAWNGVIASNSLVYVYDTTRPQVALTSTTGEGYTNVHHVPIEVSFTDYYMQGFTASSINVSGGSFVQAFSGAFDRWSFELVPTSEGPFAVKVPGKVCEDYALNRNFVSNSLSFVYDTTHPVPSISSTESFHTKQSPIPIAVTFAEPVINFALSVGTVTGATKQNLVGSMYDTIFTFELLPDGEGFVTLQVWAPLCRLGTRLVLLQWSWTGSRHRLYTRCPQHRGAFV